MQTARKNHAVSLVDLRDYFGFCIDYNQVAESVNALQNSVNSYKNSYKNPYKTIGG